LFTPEQKAAFLREEPKAKEFFRRFLGAEEFINGIERWCLWLGDCPPEKLRLMPLALERVENVRKFRLASKSTPTKKIAERPTHFHVENMPRKHYLLIPRVSAELRKYIPMGFVPPKFISSDATLIIPDATLFHFGILSSTMHMAWVRQVCGRLKSDYRYSNKLVYNNFPWPNTNSQQREPRAALPHSRTFTTHSPCRPNCFAPMKNWIAPSRNATAPNRSTPTASASNSFFLSTRSSPHRCCPSNRGRVICAHAQDMPFQHPRRYRYDVPRLNTYIPPEHLPAGRGEMENGSVCAELVRGSS
jgi:hypothetical protein